jgi:hypothetical protein
VRYLSIRNFDQYQHYKDRRPPWIKLHASVLDDYAFSCLQDASKAHLMLLWVLASKLDNRIPYDLAFLSKKLGATSAIDIEELVLHGFVDILQEDSAPLADRKHPAMPEAYTEETETQPPQKKISGGTPGCNGKGNRLLVAGELISRVRSIRNPSHPASILMLQFQSDFTNQEREVVKAAGIETILNTPPNSETSLRWQIAEMLGAA